MKEFWKTGVLILAALAFGSYVLWVDEADEFDDERPMLVDADPDSFDLLEITRGQESVVLQKEEGKDSWLMISPKQDAADAGELQSLLGTFRRLRAQRKLDWPKNLSPYGLDPPALEVKATGPDKADVMFRVGGQDVTEEYRYVAFENSLYIVSSYLLERFEKDANEFRRRDVLAFDKSEVQKISYEGLGQRVELEKDDGRWVLRHPQKEWRLAGSAVNGLLTKFGNLKVRTFVEDRPADLSAYGIAEDKKRASLFTASGAEYRVNFGKKVPEKDEVYLRAGASRGIVTVTDTWPENIFMNPVDLRDKSLFDVSYDQIDSVVVKVGDRKIRIQRDSDPGEADSEDFAFVQFRVVEPQGLTLGSRQARDVAEELAYLTVVDFLTEDQPNSKASGLDSPHYDIRFTLPDLGKGEGGPEAWVRLGSEAEKDMTIYGGASSLAPQEVVVMTSSLRKACDSLVEVLYPPD